jgi:predicted transcriptional regulator
MDEQDEKPAITNITIRLPAEIAEALRRLAKQHDRSLNGEIVRALRAYIKYVAKRTSEKQP